MSELKDRFTNDVVAYSRQHPEFWGPEGAYFGRVTARAEALANQGYSEQQMKDLLHAEEREIVERAYNEGKNPAEVIHEMAMASGWKKPAVVKELQFIKRDGHGERPQTALIWSLGRDCKEA